MERANATQFVMQNEQLKREVNQQAGIIKDLEF